MTLTKMGKILLFIIFALLFAGLNTRSNLMHLFNTFLICIWLLSPVIAQRNLTNIQIKISSPNNTFAGKQVPLQVLFINKSDENKYAIHLHDNTCHQNISVYQVLPKSQSLCTYYATYSQRKVVNWKNVSLTTTHPFGLFENKIPLSTENQLYVYPKISTIDSAFFQLLTNKGFHKHQLLTNSRTSRDSFSKLREYVQGDNPRNIDWKASAKKNDLVIREYVDLNPMECSIVMVFHSSNAMTQEQVDSFEQIIEVTASLAWEVSRKGKMTYFAVGESRIKSPTKNLNVHKALRLLTSLKISEIPFVPPTENHARNLVIITNKLTSALEKYLEKFPGTTLICQNPSKTMSEQYTFSIKGQSIEVKKLC